MKLQVTEIGNLEQLPANAIIIVYRDHYRANSGDDIYLTDNYGKTTRPFYGKHWHTFMDDRGVISAYAIMHPDGAFCALSEFRNHCRAYVLAADNLKKWEQKKPVNDIVVDGISTYGCFDSAKFEESKWYRRCAKRSKESTVNAKRAEFNAAQDGKNKELGNLVLLAKEQASKWFIDNKISVRNAYAFTSFYY